MMPISHGPRLSTKWTEEILKKKTIRKIYQIEYPRKSRIVFSEIIADGLSELFTDKANLLKIILYYMRTLSPVMMQISYKA